MFDIQVDDGGARIIRDALRLYKKQWSGGHPQEQMDIEFLEMQFTKMVLEASMDAYWPRMERGVDLLGTQLCLLISFVSLHHRKSVQNAITLMRSATVV